jgi:hypothetical protein
MVRPGHHKQPEQPSKRTVTHQRRYASRRPQGPTNEVRVPLTQTAGPAARSAPCSRTRDPRAPPTYPFLAYATVKDRSEVDQGPARTGTSVGLLRCAPKRGAEQEAYLNRTGEARGKSGRPVRRERDVGPLAARVKALRGLIRRARATP